MTSAVPQGSILGPLHFLIYVNYIDVGLGSSFRLFADDCVIFSTISRTNDCEDLPSDLNRLCYWMQLWQLGLNQSKCKVMRITNKRKKFHYTYSLNSARLEWVDTFKYPGVRINSRLTWKDHVLDVRMKATRLLNLLRRNMQGCSKQAKARVLLHLFVLT